MVKRMWMGSLVTAAGGLLLMACDSGLITGEGEGDDSSTAGQEIIIPATTKVLAPEARAALVSYDQESGTLLFNEESAGVPAPSVNHVADPAALAAGDVVVSEIAPAAPYGLLRRVTQVRATADGIEVRTERAGLGDAVEQARLETPLSVEGGKVYAPVEGVAVSMVPVENNARDVYGWPFEADWEVKFLPGFDFFTAGRCVAQDESSAKGHAKAVLGIEIVGSDVKQFGVFGEASATLSAKVACNASAADNQTFTVAQYISPPYVSYIGPVPIVFQFGIAIAGGISTSNASALTLTANWSETYNAGLGYSSGTGWGPWTGHASTPLSWDAKGNGTVRLRTGPIFALSIFSGDVFSFFNWFEVGVSAGVTGAAYALPYLEVAGVQDLENGTGSATLFGGMESGGAAGAFLSIDVSTLGWTIFSQAWSWVHSEVFPEIRNTLAQITY